MVAEKIKEKPKVNVPEQVKEAYKPKKDGQSTFDKVLEKNRMMQKAPQNTQVTTQKETHQETRVARHQEQGERGKDKDSDEKEKDRGKEKAKEERKAGAETRQRISGKGGKQDTSGQGGGKGKGHRGQGQAMQRKSKLEMKKAGFDKAAGMAAQGSKFADKLKSEMKRAHLSKEFIQNLVNQVVKFVKTGINKEGEKEIRLDLHERIFKGLRLRIATKDDKVSVQFETSNADVKELFANSSEDIQEQLEARGVSVAEIKVT